MCMGNCITTVFGGIREMKSESTRFIDKAEREKKKKKDDPSYPQYYEGLSDSAKLTHICIATTEQLKHISIIKGWVPFMGIVLLLSLILGLILGACGTIF